jgi:hypothetical protein
VLLAVSDASDRIEFNDFDDNTSDLVGQDNGQRTRKRSVRVWNDSVTDGDVIFIALGDSTVSASLPTGGGANAGSMPIPPGHVEVFEGVSARYIAAIMATGLTANLYITAGEGI